MTKTQNFRLTSALTGKRTRHTASTRICCLFWTRRSFIANSRRTRWPLFHRFFRPWIPRSPTAAPVPRIILSTFDFSTRVAGSGRCHPKPRSIYPKMPDSFPDGLSVTLLFATKYHHCGPNGGSLWADTNALSSPNAATFGASMALWQPAPTQAACNPTSGTAVSFNVQSIQVAMCDASVRSVGSGISSATWQAVHTPGGADVAGPDWEGN